MFCALVSEHARRRWVIGSDLDIWEIIRTLDGFGSIERLAAEPQLAERQTRLAVAYRDGYPEETADAIMQNRRPAAEWHELYPLPPGTNISRISGHPKRNGSLAPSRSDRLDS